MGVDNKRTAGRLALRLGVAAATCVALWFVWSFTASMVLATRDPQRALAVWPTDAARAGVAAKLIASGRPQEMARIAELGRATLARSPVNIAAARSLALSEIAMGRGAAGHRMIVAAESLSRHDMPTEMWLIEDRVAAGDIAGALKHYDHALRTSIPSRALLLPILAQASDDPRVAIALAPLLRVRPEWWSDYLGRFVERTQSAKSLRIIAQALRLDPRSEIDRQRLVSILARQVALRDWTGATALYAGATGVTPGKTGGSWVVDGGFEQDHELPPFDWLLTDESDHSAVRNPVEGASGAVALALVGTDGRDVARQLLVLQPGRYRLTAKVGMVPGGLTAAPALTIACDQSASSADPIATIPLPVTRTARAMAAMFTVPAKGCAGQVLTISSARNVGYLVDNPWIDDIDIRLMGTVPSTRPVDGR